MTPSPRVPRVPRVPRAAEASAPAQAHDAGTPPETGKVTVRGAKVTLLNPQGGDHGEGGAAHAPSSADSASPSAQTAETEASSPQARSTRAGSTRAGSTRAGSARTKSGSTRSGRAEGAPAEAPQAASGVSETGRVRRLWAFGRGGASPAGAAPQLPTQAEDGEADVLAFPEPPAKRRRRRLLVGIGVAVALVAGLFAVLLFTPLVAVRTITVEGTHLLPAGQVASALDPVRGKPLATVGSDDVERLLHQFVQVKSARALAVPPSTLVVEIVERVPVALVKQGGKLTVVDGDGVVLGDATATSQYSVPVIDGSAMPMGQAVFRSVTAVLAALPPDVLGQLATASAQSPDSVELKLSDGRTVVWGNADDRELKARVLQALMKATPEKGQPAPQVFDVSTPRHPVTR